MQLDLVNDDAGTEVGSYFIANYPPFSAWRREEVPAALRALEVTKGTGSRERGSGINRTETPLGLYLHIPFCRKRCKFCYFRVYTDRNARDVESYLTALIKEVELYSRQPIVGDRT